MYEYEYGISRSSWDPFPYIWASSTPDYTLAWRAIQWSLIESIDGLEFA